MLWHSIPAFFLRSPSALRVKTLFRLLTLFMTVPILELFFLIQVERLFDYWTDGYGLIATMVLIVVTAVVGSYLAKREGLSAWRRLQGRLGEGGLPGDELLDAVIILVAGAFLITPGVLTDLVGFIGLFPLTRGGVRRLIKRRLKKAVREGKLQTSFGTFGSPPGGPFDSPGREADPDAGHEPAGDTANRPAVGGTPAARGPSPKPENGTAVGTPNRKSRSPGTREDADEATWRSRPEEREQEPPLAPPSSDDRKP